MRVFNSTRLKRCYQQPTCQHSTITTPRAPPYPPLPKGGGENARLRLGHAGMARKRLIDARARYKCPVRMAKNGSISYAHRRVPNVKYQRRSNGKFLLVMTLCLAQFIEGCGDSAPEAPPESPEVTLPIVLGSSTDLGSVPVDSGRVVRLVKIRNSSNAAVQCRKVERFLRMSQD